MLIYNQSVIRGLNNYCAHFVMLIYDNANDSHGFASILSQAEDEWLNQAWTDRSTNLKSKTKTLYEMGKNIFSTSKDFQYMFLST